MKTLAELHHEIENRRAALVDAMDAVFLAADAAASVAEDDPSMSGYLEALAPLMSLTVPPLPPSPTL